MDPGINQYRLTNVIRLFGAAQSVTNFATSPCYLSSLGIVAANTLWDGTSNWAGLSAGANVVPNYAM